MVDTTTEIVKFKQLIAENILAINAPCDECSSSRDCSQHSLACRSFMAWTDDRKDYKDFSTIPSPRLYQHIFK